MAGYTTFDDFASKLITDYCPINSKYLNIGAMKNDIKKKLQDWWSEKVEDGNIKLVLTSKNDDQIPKSLETETQRVFDEEIYDHVMDVIGTSKITDRVFKIINSDIWEKINCDITEFTFHQLKMSIQKQ